MKSKMRVQSHTAALSDSRAKSSFCRLLRLGRLSNSADHSGCFSMQTAFPGLKVSPITAYMIKHVRLEGHINHLYRTGVHDHERGVA